YFDQRTRTVLESLGRRMRSLQRSGVVFGRRTTHLSGLRSRAMTTAAAESGDKTAIRPFSATTRNALPQFVTEIDGLDIHFIHVRSKHEGALALIVTHGWPSSVVAQLEFVEPLTNPTAHGAMASDAFHLVIPSLPGHGVSGPPEAAAWDSARVTRA